MREHYNDRRKYVLVDEFQDTDSLQFRLIKALCPPKQSNACVFCVGDDDHLILRLSRAKVGNMSDFVKDYKVEKIIKLEQNYRSTSHILDGANAVIANNKDRMGKNLWTDAGAGEPICLYRAEADMQEARAVVQDIMVEKRRGKKYSDFAILYRNNNLSRNFERMLSANSISLPRLRRPALFRSPGSQGCGGLSARACQCRRHEPSSHHQSAAARDRRNDG